MSKGIKGFQKGNKISVGRNVTEKTRKKMSISGKKRFENGSKQWNKGLKGYTNKGSFKKGEFSGDKNPSKRPEIRKKISLSLIGHQIYKDKNRSKKLSIARKREYKLGLRINPTKGKKRSEEVKKKIRITKQNRFIKLEIPSSIGKNESKILDNLEVIVRKKIIRQYPTIGYWIDGYVPELKLAIEIDEKEHYDVEGNLKEKDKERQIRIERELNCNFIRIKDKYEVSQIINFVKNKLSKTYGDIIVEDEKKINDD